MVAQDSNSNTESNSSVEKVSIKPGRILGRVFDDDTGEALSGVTIAFEDKSIETKTDLEGRYRQSNLEPGIYSLLFFKEGEWKSPEHCLAITTIGKKDTQALIQTHRRHLMTEIIHCIQQVFRELVCKIRNPDSYST